jgi:glutathione S-transferase
MVMKLYGSLTSPYVRKVRVLLKEKQIACEFVLSDAWAADSPVPAMNPLGTVPVFERDDGTFLFDSPLICEYLDAQKAPALIPEKGEARWQVLQWHALAQGMLDATVTRLLESRQPAERQSADQIARQEAKIARALAHADRAATREFLVGDRFGFADLALGVALEYIDFRYAHSWRERHGRLAEWHARIGARPSFVETLPPGMERPAAANR